LSLEQIAHNKEAIVAQGVDPSADSMTIGNLAAGMMARLFIKHGHKAVLLVGGATGMIGDPDGKSEERDLLSLEQIAHNKEAIVAQYSQVFGGLNFSVVDNYDWFKDLGYLEFLRAVGKHVPMRQMLGREFVQSRLGEDGAGISYAEFSYSLIQGYDFLHLYKEHGVTLQLCGADQWGNSIAGVELIRRIAGAEAHIWSSPLVINRATGKKFGKTEDGAVWLDTKRTSIFKFYQFWINCDDEGIEEYLKIYTDLDRETLEDIMSSHNEARSNRLAQKHLAYEVTKIVHGAERADAVRRVSEVLFGEEDYTMLTEADFAELRDEIPTLKVAYGTEIVDVLVGASLASSKGEARRFLQSNAVYINGEQLPLIKTQLDTTDAIHGYCILRRGKNMTALLEFTR
jgi:tyrosyl-tRNA synthetase